MRRWIVTLLLLCGWGRMAGADPVAMACRVTGRPETQKAGKGEWKPLALMQKLQPHDKVRCGAGSEAILVLYAGSQRFAVRPGVPAEVQANTIMNATSLGGLKGPSAAVAQALSGGRVGAVLSRAPEAPRDLYPGFAGWMPASAREFSWGGEGWPDAASAKYYLLTLYNTSGIAILTQRIDTWQPVENGKGRVTAACPGLAELKPGRPYVWHLAAFGANGGLKKDVHWGVLTLLNAAEAEEFTRQAKELDAQMRIDPADTTPRILLAEYCRQNGVLMAALDLLNAPGMPKNDVEQALKPIYHDLGPQAMLLGGKYEQLIEERLHAEG